jgi:hypothetical protein
MPSSKQCPCYRTLHGVPMHESCHNLACPCSYTHRMGSPRMCRPHTCQAHTACHFGSRLLVLGYFLLASRAKLTSRFHSQHPWAPRRRNLQGCRPLRPSGNGQALTLTCSIACRSAWEAHPHIHARSPSFHTTPGTRHSSAFQM